MDVHKLRYFSKVVETCSVRRAAELLKISPGALSKSMKQLEADYQKKLFNTEGRQLHVTDEGRDLYRLSRSLLQEYETLIDRLGSSKSSRPKLRIATYGGYISWAVGEISNVLKNTGLSALFRFPGDLERAVLSDEADFGITHLPFPDPELTHLEVARFHMAIYQRPGAFAGQRLEEIPMVVPHLAPPDRHQGLQTFEGWPAAQVQRLERFTTESLELALELCRRGLAATFAPKYIIAAHNRLVREEYQLVPRPLPSDFAPVGHTVYLTFRKASSEVPFRRCLAQALQRVCASE